MYEIELKAHVKDRKALIEKLDSIADFAGAVSRDDQYYYNKNKVKIRLRKETFADGKVVNLLTYKQKENLDGTEVNDEKECQVSDFEPVLCFLKDAGFSLKLTKHKDVMDWTCQDATYELCNVPPLGDFLEIEILSPVNDDATVKAKQHELHELLKKAGIPESEIEERYYSEMLRKAGA